MPGVPAEVVTGIELTLAAILGVIGAPNTDPVLP